MDASSNSRSISEPTGAAASPADPDRPPLLIGAILVASAIGRGASLTGLPDTPDGVRLVASLERFDLLTFSPHFPGYPLGVAVARAIPIAGGAAWSALQVGACLLAIPLAVLLAIPRRPGSVDRPLTTSTTRTLAVAILCAHPFLALESLRVGTDFLALPFVYAGLLLLSAGDRSMRGSVRGGVLLGLSLGFRPSLFPWLAALLFAPHRRGAVGGAAIGLAAWILPSAAVIGARSWIEEGRRFVGGHFTTWGGGIGSEAAGGDRFVAAIRSWVFEPLLPGMHGGVAAVLLLALVIGGIHAVRSSGRERRGRTPSPLAAGAGAYLLWIAIAQHPDHARHAIPLVPLALAAAIGGLARLPVPSPARGVRAGGIIGAGLVLAALVATTASVDLLRAYRDSEPPALVAARALARDPRFDPLLDRLYVGDDRAFFRNVGPAWSIGTGVPIPERPRSEGPDSTARHDLRTRALRSIARDLDSLPLPPRRVWVSSRLIGLGDDDDARAPPLGRSTLQPGIVAISAARPERLGSYGPRIDLWLFSNLESEPR